MIPSATSRTVSVTHSRVLGVARHRHLGVVEHVVVGLLGGLELPRLARADGVQRELHVGLELGRGLGPAGLVVDQLVAAVGQPVDAVHAAAYEVVAEAERERPLQPHRVGRARPGSARGSGSAPRSPWRAAGAPRRSRRSRRGASRRRAGRAARPGSSSGGWVVLAVVALEHLVDEDPEALVDRRLLRDPEDARELVLQRAGQVGLDVRGREHEPGPAAGQERLERRLRAGRQRRGPAALVAHRRRAGSRRGSSVSNTSRWSGDRPWPRRALMAGSVSSTVWPGWPLDQRAELEQLEVADDGVGDVEVGVEPQLAQPAADRRDRVEHLVAQRPERWRAGSRPGRRAPPRAPPTRRPARRAPPRRTARAAGLGAAPRSARGRRARAVRRARVIATCSSRRISARCAARESGGSSSCSSASGIGSNAAAARAGHARRLQPEHVDGVELQPLGRVHGHHLHRRRGAGARWPPPRCSPASATAAM